MTGPATKTNRPPIEAHIGEDGLETATVAFEPPGQVDVVLVGPSRAIPVIFLPGIMGSPLIATGSNRNLHESQGPWAWNPDDSGWMLRCYGKLNGQLRKTLLTPNAVRPLRPHEVPNQRLQDNVSAIPAAEARRRGWGSVMLTSYGEILNYLETQLYFIYSQNTAYPGIERARPGNPASWGQLKGYQRLTDAELQRAAGWRFPVYAVGYNWMDSNEAGSTYLKQRVDEIRRDCRERLRLRCDKVILVTHSMGGLLGRRFAQRYPNDVLGVVHGVQPAIGAATAYARVRSGWEWSMSIWTLPTLTSAAAAHILGPTGEEVTTVFAGGAGPLELLPNQRYGRGWLQMQHEQTTVLSLPERDPYDEIYAEPQAWYRLIHAHLLVPTEDRRQPEKIMEEWNNYQEQLKYARRFHTRLGNYYHPLTYAHCGADNDQKTWHRVVWQLQSMSDAAAQVRAPCPTDSQLRQARLQRDDLRGRCNLHIPGTERTVMVTINGVGVPRHYAGDHYLARLANRRDAGDATVPAHSGIAPRAHSTFFAQMTGFEHQASYSDPKVQGATLYSVLRIAQTAETSA